MIKLKLNKKELNILLDEIFELGQEGEIIDWLLEGLFSNETKEKLLIDYTGTLTTYFFYLKKADMDEDYSLCSKLMRAIKIEEENFIGLARKTNWFDEKILDEILNIKEELLLIYKNERESENE